ncbi:MAG: hypothetical protein LUE86_10570 [Clostridiales bacterium]|nr:hypothetical protein [Clostridiales bacterium]
MAGFADASKLPAEAESNIPKGKLYHIACKTWFTSTGAAMPLSFKFEDDIGEIQMVRDITVRYAEEKNFSGIPSREYGCEAVIGGMVREFRLIFYCETCLWVMLI